MAVEIDTRGVELELKRLAAQEKPVRNAGLKKAAQAVASRLRENTVVYEGKRDGKWKAQRQYERENGVNQAEFPHMRDDVQTSNVDINGDIRIGYGKKTYWRAHFVELGTIKQPPQGFIQRTEEEMRGDVMDIMTDEFRRGLGL